MTELKRVSYETEESLLNEELFLDKIEQRFRCSSIKMPTYREFDYILTRPFKLPQNAFFKKPVPYAVSIAELKCRKVKSTDYPTCVLGEHKVRTALKFKRYFATAENKPLPFIFFVRYLDKDVYVGIESLDGFKREKFSARNHAENIADTEWVIHVPKESFRTF